MDEKRTPTRNESSVDNAVFSFAFQLFRTALSEQAGPELSPDAMKALDEICAEARRRGVLPEQLIIRVKAEIRSVSQSPGQDWEERERKLLDQAVTRCIQSFFATARPLS